MIFPIENDRIFNASDTGPSGTLVWYHLQLPDDESTLQNVMAAIILLVDERNWDANNQTARDAFVSSFNTAVQTFELE